MAKKSLDESAVEAHAFFEERAREWNAAKEQTKAQARILVREKLKASRRDLSGLEASLRRAIAHETYLRVLVDAAQDVSRETAGLARYVKTI